MAGLSVVLSEKQMEKSINTLTNILATAKGEERKVIKELLDKLSPGLDAHRRVVAIEQQEAAATAEIEAVGKLVLDVLPVMQKRGLTPSAIRYTESVSEAFDQAEARAQKKLEEKTGAVPRSQRHSVNLTLAELQDAALKPLTKRLTKLAESYLNSSDQRLEASQDFTLAPKRENLAKQCFASALREGRGAAQWDSVDMIAMSFGDQLTHMKLAVALLEGDPKKIDEASCMDTATRENLADSVWNFVRGDAIKQIERVTKARGPRR